MEFVIVGKILVVILYFKIKMRYLSENWVWVKIKWRISEEFVIFEGEIWVYFFFWKDEN